MTYIKIVFSAKTTENFEDLLHLTSIYPLFYLICCICRRKDLLMFVYNFLSVPFVKGFWLTIFSGFNETISWETLLLRPWQMNTPTIRIFITSKALACLNGVFEKKDWFNQISIRFLGFGSQMVFTSKRYSSCGCNQLFPFKTLNLANHLLNATRFGGTIAFVNKSIQ